MAPSSDILNHIDHSTLVQGGASTSVSSAFDFDYLPDIGGGEMENWLNETLCEASTLLSTPAPVGAEGADAAAGAAVADVAASPVISSIPFAADGIPPIAAPPADSFSVLQHHHYGEQQQQQTAPDEAHSAAHIISPQLTQPRATVSTIGGVADSPHAAAPLLDAPATLGTFQASVSSMHAISDDEPSSSDEASNTNTRKRSLKQMTASTATSASSAKRASSTAVATQRKTTRKTTTRRTAKSTGGSKRTETAAELQKRLRRESNRVSAKKSRNRKKQKTEMMQQALIELKEENAKLRNFIYSQFGSAQTANQAITQACEQQQQPAAATAPNAPSEDDDLIVSLKQSENRVMDESTLAFLQGLQTTTWSDVEFEQEE